MIHTDVKEKNEMQTWCQQGNKSLKRWPPQLPLLYLASEQLADAEWQKKVSLLCLPWPAVAWYSEEAEEVPSIL